MPAPKRISPAPSSAAFTLVELLVVISIIVILMSLLLTAIPAVKNAANVADARNTANQIVVALNAYYTEYAKFPPLYAPGAAPATTAVGDSIVGETAMGGEVVGQNNMVFYTLRNIPKGPNQNYAANPRKVSFYEGNAAKVNAAGRARKGFYDKTSNGGIPSSTEESCLYDPWSHQFGVVLDADGDDRIDLTNFYNDFAGVDPSSGLAPRRKAGAFSMGKDEALGTKGNHTYRSGAEKSDDVVSWEQ